MNTDNLTINPNIINAMLAEVTFDVFQFCKEKNIECNWDFDRRKGLEWTEVLLNGEMVLQVDRSCTRHQFVELCQLMNKDFINGHKDVSHVSGNDFWFAVEDENLFKDFFKEYEHLFNA